MQSDPKLPPALNAPRARYDIVAICGVLALLILALDVAAPMGIAGGALYVTVVAFSLLADSATITWRVAGVLTLLTILGGLLPQLLPVNFLHRTGTESIWIILANRGVSLIVIWMTATMGVRLLRVKRQVIEHGIELHRMNVELHRIARHDALTGVANRRHFDESLRQEFLRAMRDKSPLSLLMIDVDHFKQYNDKNGHQAGDVCLVRVAQAIQSSLRRPADLVARYGGEEFAVILPSTNVGGASERAEAIRRKIEEMQVERPGTQENTSVTVSVGVAVAIPGDMGANPTKLIAAADGALFQVKQKGRNSVALAEGNGRSANGG
ncbi:MAG TPA: diguanylate cyclase [Planctomycetota bacterium]|nr:diguanylate cyclase [Planctomycetota bacterium]